MGKAEYRSAIRSRKLICDALGELMEEKSLDKITVTDVVKKADINRSTFYAHYENIPDVIDQQVRIAGQTICDAASQRLTEPSEIPDPFVILEQLQKLLESNVTFYTRILNSEISEKLTESLRQFFESYMFENERIYQPREHENYAVVVSCTSGCVAAMYRDWFLGKLDITLDELTKKATDATRLLLENMMQ